MPSSKRFGGWVRNSPSLICDDPPSLKLRRTGNNLCLYPMRFVKGRNVLAVSSWQAAGYEKNGPELERKIRGGRRSQKRVNLCKCLIINRRTLHYFYSLALTTSVSLLRNPVCHPLTPNPTSYSQSTPCFSRYSRNVTLPVYGGFDSQ